MNIGSRRLKSSTTAADDLTTSAQRVATRVYEHDKMINYVAAMRLARHMIKAGNVPDAVAEAMIEVVDSGKPLAGETIRIALKRRRPRSYAPQNPWEVE